MKRKYVLWTIALLVLSAVGIYAYTEYNRKPVDLSSVSPRASVAASDLVDLYSRDERQANDLYLGKPIEVTGVISEISNQHDTLVTIMLGGNEDLHRVSCLLDKKYTMQARRWKPGDHVTFRGSAQVT